MSDLAKRSKVNLDLWNLFIAIICLIRLNISSENNNFGFNCIQKINFSKKKSHLNALGSKLTLTLSRSRST